MPAPTPPPASSQDPSSRARRMRRYLIRMVLLVAVLHAAAVALYFVLDIPTAAPRLRMIFVVAWTVATLVLVSAFLRRIRLVRRGYDVE